MIKSYIYTHHIVNKLTVALQIYSKVLTDDSIRDGYTSIHVLLKSTCDFIILLKRSIIFQEWSIKKYSTIKINVKIFQKYTELYRFDT